MDMPRYGRLSPPKQSRTWKPKGHFRWIELGVFSIHSFYLPEYHVATLESCRILPQHTRQLYIPWASPSHCPPSPEDTSLTSANSGNTCKRINLSHTIFIFLSAMCSKIFRKVLLFKLHYLKMFCLGLSLCKREKEHHLFLILNLHKCFLMNHR